MTTTVLSIDDLCDQLRELEAKKREQGQTPAVLVGDLVGEFDVRAPDESPFDTMQVGDGAFSPDTFADADGTAALRRADPALLHTIIVDEDDLLDGAKTILNDQAPPRDEEEVMPPLTEYEDLIADDDLDACDICRKHRGVEEADIQNEETGELTTAWLCPECYDRLIRYNHDEPDAFDDVETDDRLATDGGYAFSDLHAFKRDILYAVRDLERDEPPKGLAIKRTLEDDYETVHHSRLYQNLSQLVTSGLLDKGQKNGRTNEYETTEATRRMLEASTRRRAEQLGIAATGGDA